jgi:ribulose-5-phosphate 4-epimerase/fuculose-1-phosphate aldolase
MSTYLKSTASTSVAMTDAEHSARVKLAACYRIFDHLGWTELIFNHISLRVPGPERLLLINPFGLHYREVTASNLVLINLQGEAMRESPWPVNRAGFVIHSALHAAIDEAHCVMHTHTTAGVAVSCLKSGLSPHNFYGYQLNGRVAYHDFEGRTVDEGERTRLVRNVGDRRIVMLRNHGLLTWGPTVDEAFFDLYMLQRACEVQVASAAAGEINEIATEVLADGSRLSSQADNRRKCEDVFAALQRLMDAKDPSYRQ